MKKVLSLMLISAIIISSQLQVFAQPVIYSNNDSKLIISKALDNKDVPIKLDNQGPYDRKYYRKLTKKEQKCLISLGLGTLELASMTWAGVISAAGTVTLGCFYD